jgi:hypothetical protein
MPLSFHPKQLRDSRIFTFDFICYASINLLHLARKNADFALRCCVIFWPWLVGDDAILRGF